MLLLMGRSSRGVIDGRGDVGGAIGDVGNLVGARIWRAVDRPRDENGGIVELVERGLLVVLTGEGFPGGNVGELGGGGSGARGRIRGREGGGRCGKVGG